VVTSTEERVLIDGLAFGESPRWHEGRLWVADCGTQEVVAVDLAAEREEIVRVDFPSSPTCMDWLPDGRLLVVSARDGPVLRLEPDRGLVPHADLSGLAESGHPSN
jgi:sugar lactone lactonase YvrE